ncbi:30S ribosomal protein S21, partial [bacterium]|nr:30S ribosomal protein S21 [bacterium]
MTEVIIRDNESFDKALKRFKRKCQRDGVMREVKRRQHYEKPSEEKKNRINKIKRKRSRDE